MIKRPDISLSLQTGIVVLCFLLIVGTVSLLGHVGRQALSTAQDRVRDLNAAQTAVQIAEKAILLRDLALFQALAENTAESRDRLDQADRDARAATEVLLVLPTLDQQARADALPAQISALRRVEVEGQALMARLRDATTPAERLRLLQDHARKTVPERSSLSPSTALGQLSDLVQEQLTQTRAERNAAIEWLGIMSWLAAAVVALAAVAAFAVIHSRISAPVRRLASVMDRLANDDLNVMIPFQNRLDEIGAISRALLIFRNLAISQNDDLQVKRALSDLSTVVLEQKSLLGFAEVSVTALARNLGASVACFYVFDEQDDTLSLFAAYGYSADDQRSSTFAMGEGLIGQAARDRKMITLSPVPEDYIKVTSGLGNGAPGLVLVVPVVVLNRLIGVMEFGTFQPFDKVRRRIIDEATSAVALPLENLKRALDTRQLLEQSRRQTEELQAAEEELRTQQAELEAANSELAQRSTELERSREEALTRAKELEQTSQYKSRFLTNMSHELRTPLNSMLILAQDLSENTEGNLDPQQIEAARVIHASGISLLRLINEILDLSKIEAGKIEVLREQMSVASLCRTLERSFRPAAEQKGIAFEIDRDPALPALICTDAGRLEQIANNLIGNALKFTQDGSVSVALKAASGGTAFNLVVSDTGIGIPSEKLETIFQPFEQVDASTHRHFGGTGLGLAISRQLASLLGGTLTVESTLGKGSRFSLLLPIERAISLPGASASASQLQIALDGLPPSVAPEPIKRPSPEATRSNTVLVVEDDVGSQMAISQLLSRDGIKVVSVLNAKDALEHLDRSRFDCMILDIGLPDLSGFELLDLLAQRERTLPVVIYSARDMLPDEILRLREFTDSIILKGEHSDKRLLEEVREFLSSDAQPDPGQAEPSEAAVALRPAEAAITHSVAPDQLACKLLLVDDDMRNIYALAKVLRARGMEVLLAQDGLKALKELDDHPDVQLVLMDMMMPVMDGFEAMAEIRKRGGRWAELPIIALTAKAMKGDRAKCLEAGASDYLTKPIDLQQLLAMIRELLARGR